MLCLRIMAMLTHAANVVDSTTWSEVSQAAQAMKGSFGAKAVGTSAAARWEKLDTSDNRTADVYVPNCASKASPILLVVHGLGYTPDIQEKMDQFTAQAAEECTVVVYPQGEVLAEHFPGGGFSWNAGGCCPGADLQHVDDMAFLEHVIEIVAERYQVNGHSVFVTGISNGAMMANRLACVNSRVKGLIAVAGTLVNGTGSEAFSCDRNVPTLYFHGLRDPLIPMGGCNKTWSSFGRLCPMLMKYDGFPEEMPTVKSYISFLRARNGITDELGKVTYQKGGATCTSWGGHGNNVTFCQVDDLGHMWPGAKGVVPGACEVPWFHCNYDVDATEQAWSFIRGLHNTETFVI